MPDLLTLAALGVVAYVSETLLHEAVGHGGACLALGGRVESIAPLYMRCSVTAPALAAAGPGMNLLAGAAGLLALRGLSGRSRHFAWLVFVFNWLIAAGYLLVGAATGFGDWGALFAGVSPDWHWRAPAALAALAFYMLTLRIASRLFLGTRAVMILVPAAAAAVTALAAQIYGQGTDARGLALAFGCTLFVGFTLFWTAEDKIPEHIGRSLPWITLGLAAAAGFIVFVGPGPSYR
jgi:hypothetical protein